MTELVRRKRRLVLETPYQIRGRALIVHVEAAGLRLREKGCRSGLQISWAQVYNRAAEIAAERARKKAGIGESETQPLAERPALTSN